MQEPEIRVEHREVLTYLLAEAAEIEHGLMCCYLFASQSIGAPAQRDQPPERAARLRAWSQDILAVARDEMLHLALVANLTNAIGASPHLLRPNFPVGTGYHPAGVVVSLAPFSLATMDHFVYLERPEGVELADGAGFAPAREYARTLAHGRLVPSAQDYRTVGHLYRGIRAGIDALAESLGEEMLFCGDPQLQAGERRIVMPGLQPVVDVQSAHAAIDAILAQGEGTAEATHDSHYCRFVRIRDELREILRDEPGFEPTRGVARNPVMRRPPNPETLVWIDAEPAASVLDVGNALYMVMMRALDALFSPLANAPVVADLAGDAAFTAMAAVTKIGELLTELPASELHPGVRA
ncbi:MAG: ferritin-like protein, partial [Deltaproteobacteria bacterium]|nr:ferritin-like protein [Nannocystaceae bacterium]